MFSHITANKPDNYLYFFGIFFIPFFLMGAVLGGICYSAAEGFVQGWKDFEGLGKE